MADDLNLDEIMGKELGNDSGAKEAVKALTEEKFDQKTGKSNIDKLTDLSPREIKGMSGTQTLATVSEVKINNKGEILVDHGNLKEILGEYTDNMKRHKVSLFRKGRNEVTSVFAQPSMIMPQEQQEKRGFRKWLSPM